MCAFKNKNKKKKNKPVKKRLLKDIALSEFKIQWLLILPLASCSLFIDIEQKKVLTNNSSIFIDFYYIIVYLKGRLELPMMLKAFIIMISPQFKRRLARLERVSPPAQKKQTF